MIGEHDIAAGFHSFWSEAVPLLTPSCVTVFNRSYGAYLEGFRPVDREINLRPQQLDQPDLLAEVGFELFRSAVERGQPFPDLGFDADVLQRAWAIGLHNISKHRVVQPVPVPQPFDLSHRYLSALGRRYEALRGMLHFEEAAFGLKLSGCGVLGQCEVDISVQNILIEVKTVDRNFSSRDIKQVIIYLTLDYLSGVKRWDSAWLFNPRRAYLVRFSPAEFFSYITAGKSAPQLYREVEEFLLSRDFMLEHRF